MYTMDQIHRIRELYFEQGKNLAEIAEILGCDWRTVRKYVDQTDFSPLPPQTQKAVSHKSKLDRYKPEIDTWLEADRKAPRKQRHTATRVFHRLTNKYPDFDVSYRLVAQYVSEKKEQLNLKKEEGYIPLIHRPGEAQADFGTADFYENGKYYEKGKYLVLSFPYSNGGYLQLNYGENLECLLEGLQNIFQYVGGVPTEIWFDNTKTIVTEIIRGGGRELTDRFRLFSEHYRFKPVFMNPVSGNEKGNVENKVGYLRRNELVPLPEFMNLAEKNTSLLASCDADMDREHYDKELFISELFEEDRKAFLPLPEVLFDTALYATARTDKYGKFRLNGGKHECSASPAICEGIVHLKITSDTVVVMDEDFREIVHHRRLYGDSEQKSMEWLPYLKYIARKPRSLRNSGIYEILPVNIRKYMDSCANSDRGQILKVLAELTERSGFESAVRTVNQALVYDAVDPDSLKNLYRRVYSDVPELPPMKEADSILPAGKVIQFNCDLDFFDSVLRKAGAANE
ncbi:MAG: IS21 family transposase [Eubacteriales bacterium]|nr:IS21 family transposase [Eubacteriales bacterium]